MSTLEPTKGNMPAVLQDQERAVYGGQILATLSPELQAAKNQANFEGLGL